ncbi:hypothetical protein KC333_g154 [Hortaea werneckii]|nr:hypothetical protein KC333_g154 [Hortaea werneckii]
MAAANDLSLADAKLARQLKRNEKAEATLTAPIAERQNSRGKHKIWKHLDMNVDMPKDEGGVSLSQAESRLNDFRPMTRDSSLSRSLSSLSQHTTGTLQSESGRAESTIVSSTRSLTCTRRNQKRGRRLLRRRQIRRRYITFSAIRLHHLHTLKRILDPSTASFNSFSIRMVTFLRINGAARALSGKILANSPTSARKSKDSLRQTV